MEKESTVNGRSSEDTSGLRRPQGQDVDALTAQTNSLSIGSNGQGANNVTPSKNPNAATALSPFAAEFVPRFVPSPKVQQPTYNAPAPNGRDWMKAVESFPDELEPDDYLALSELKEVIDNISSTPSNYEGLVVHITEILNNCVDEDEDIVLQCVVNTIVDQAITDQNFRYNGVRMCVHLIENLTIGATKSFKEILLQRCQREFLRRESLAIATDGGTYLRGVALFIGDLSTRCTEKELIEWLPDLINTLLSHPTPDNVKSAVLVLKLCGSNLDEHYARLNSEVFEKIFEKLQKMSETESNSQVVNILVNVIELRGRGWKAPPPPAGLYNPYAASSVGGGDGGYNPPPPQPSYTPNYGNHGNQGYGAGGYGGPTSYDFGPCGDEQDNDVCDAFEEFLRNSGQMN